MKEHFDLFIISLIIFILNKFKFCNVLFILRKFSKDYYSDLNPLPI